MKRGKWPFPSGRQLCPSVQRHFLTHELFLFAQWSVLKFGEHGIDTILVLAIYDAWRDGIHIDPMLDQI